MFEIRAKDGLGRIGRLDINGKTVETPTIMPVINPTKTVITPREIQELVTCPMIITNAYIIYTSPLKEKALEYGLHALLDFDGIIETDSGSYQLMSYGNINVTNEEIIAFQQDIESDITTFLDIPTTPDVPYAKAASDLEKTLERARKAVTIKRTAMNGTVQGGKFLELRKKAAQAMGDFNFDIYPIGAVVPFLLQYDFESLVDIILTCKKYLPVQNPVHLFGAGHPLVLAFAVLLGCDLFDSAAYVLYAKGNRYLTSFGTKKLEDLQYFPCECPVCTKNDPEEVQRLPPEERVKFLAKHNLYSTFAELHRIKQAIHEGSLWELVESRIRNHPHLYESYKIIEKYSFLEEFEPFTKRSGFFYTGEETKLRPVYKRVKNRIHDVQGPWFDHPIFGKVPVSLSQTYPFHTDRVFDIRDKKVIEDIVVYQFGKKACSFFGHGIRVVHGRTGKIRHVYKDDVLLGTLRPLDGLFVLTFEGAELLHGGLPYPERRVVVDEEAVPFVKEGKDVFAKFVLEIDEKLRAYEEVLTVDCQDVLLGVGKLLLAPAEVKVFTRGVAVQSRRGVNDVYDD